MARHAALSCVSAQRAHRRYHGPGLARLRDREIEDVPFYGNVVRTSVGGVDVASLQYLMLYPVNYGYR